MMFALAAAMLAALAAYAFFNAAETAAFTLSPADAAKLKAARPAAGLAVETLLRDRRRVLMSVLLGNLGVSVLYFNLTQALADTLPRSFNAAFQACAVGALIVFGEMLPKAAVLRGPAAAAAATATPLRWAVLVLGVPAAVLGRASRALRRMWGAEEEEGDLDPRELARLLEVAAKRGALGEDEHGWLRELVLLAEISVKEAMTPRVSVTGFDLERPREDFVALFRRERRNKVPVWSGSVDRLQGWIDAKEALAAPERDLRELVRPIGFIPESATAADALALLRRTAGRILAVVDEYGGFEGIVTREDLVECVFGDLADETEEVEDLVVETSPGRFLVDASLPVTESRRAFGAGLGAGHGAATLGGLVSAALKRLPRVGDEVRLGRVIVRVAAVRRRTASKLVVRHVATPESSAEVGS